MNSESVPPVHLVPRHAASVAKALASESRVVAIVGPRQTGKTTLVRAVFGDRPYVSLEEPDDVSFARENPRRFLGQFPDGAVSDEAQRCPDIFSFLQGIIDRQRLLLPK